MIFNSLPSIPNTALTPLLDFLAKSSGVTPLESFAFISAPFCIKNLFEIIGIIITIQI